jgi:hypothetical protein
MIRQKYASIRQAPHAGASASLVMPCVGNRVLVTRASLYNQTRTFELDYLTSFECTMLECLKHGNDAVYRQSLSILARGLIERLHEARPNFVSAPRNDHMWHKEIRRVVHAIDCAIP